MFGLINSMNVNNNLKKGLGMAVLYVASTSMGHALTYPYPKTGNIIGGYQKITAPANDTLLGIAEKFDIGVYEMLRANPKLSEKKLKTSTQVNIPSQFTLPSGPHEGIVIDLADLRIYFFHPNKDLISTYPVGIGRQGWATPMGTTNILSKKANPYWYPPSSIREEAESRGKFLPGVVPPGPHNPLGAYAIRLGFKNILIHGTTQPHSIGLRSSHGCIRMYAQDIQELFHLVSISTPVRVIYEPNQKD